MIKIYFTVPVIRTMTLVLFAVVFLLPLSARSEIKKGSFEVSPFVGYNFFENAQNLKDHSLYGGRLGYNVTKNFGIEGALEFIKSAVDDSTITGTKEGQFRSPVDAVSLTFYHIDAVYHFTPESKFTPFVAAGFGGAHYSTEISDQDMSTFDFGIGAKYQVADNIAFRIDLRDNIVTEVIPFDQAYHNIHASVGIVFAFGGTARSGSAPIVESEPKAMVTLVVLEDNHFEFDKSAITREGETILDQNIRILNENPNVNIRIAGYTSAHGTADYNQKLSERRAEAVRDYLVKGGIAPDRLTTIGYGKTRPAEYEPIPENIYSKEAKANMRVLFEVIVK
jgi:OmpA-OmpF porin, OOP family